VIATARRTIKADLGMCAPATTLATFLVIMIHLGSGNCYYFTTDMTPEGKLSQLSGVGSSCGAGTWFTAATFHTAILSYFIYHLNTPSSTKPNNKPAKIANTTGSR
jgi:hypothetical protein